MRIERGNRSARKRYLNSRLGQQGDVPQGGSALSSWIKKKVTGLGPNNPYYSSVNGKPKPKQLKMKPYVDNSNRDLIPRKGPRAGVPDAARGERRGR
jgi:hypothetical protein